jgi:hypothetical protein
MYLEDDDVWPTLWWRLLRRRLLRWGLLRWRLSRRRLLGRHFALNFDPHGLLDGLAWHSHHEFEGRRLLQADLILAFHPHLAAVQEDGVLLGRVHLPVQHSTPARGHHFLAGPEHYLRFSARDGEYPAGAASHEPCNDQERQDCRDAE